MLVGHPAVQVSHLDRLMHAPVIVLVPVTLMHVLAFILPLVSFVFPSLCVPPFVKLVDAAILVVAL